MNVVSVDSDVLLDIMTEDKQWAVRGWKLLTRNGTRYRSYVPTLQLVAP